MREVLISMALIALVMTTVVTVAMSCDQTVSAVAAPVAAWEVVCIDRFDQVIERMRVEGGWLYRASSKRSDVVSICFVPYETKEF